VTVLRPPAVYGPGDKELKPLLDIMWRGLAVVPHHAHPFSLIHVEDVVRAALAWLDTPNCPAGPFEIDDGRAGGYRWNDVIAAVSRLSGRRTRVLRVPRRLLMVPAIVNSVVGRVGLASPMVTPGKVNELYHSDWVCHSAPFAECTSWRPTIGLDAGLRTLFGDPPTERVC
jgi:nucleoside-diphosphate-sugar epimerase